MNQTKLVVHKGLTNQLNFYVRNRDRVLQNPSTKTLYASIINPNTSRRVVFKPLSLINSGTSVRSKVRFNCWRSNRFKSGFYLFNYRKSDSGVSQNLYMQIKMIELSADLEVEAV